ncbi:MAG: hypothetical protein M3M97_05775 [Actinomycetota bacterium]|nr:hypothetical protein [Actinomycetota bacterium]
MVATAYCGCGYEIWSELWWKESGYALVFSDGLKTSETHGERITHCPGCGRRLERGVLRPTRDGGYAPGARQRQETV